MAVIEITHVIYRWKCQRSAQDFQLNRPGYPLPVLYSPKTPRADELSATYRFVQPEFGVIRC